MAESLSLSRVEAFAPNPGSRHRSLRVFRQSRNALGGLVILVFFALFAVLGPTLSPYDPNMPSLGGRLASPSAAHLLGTDELGRDLMTRLAIGARFSLLLSVIATAVATVLGVPLGLIGGYYGGRVDFVLQRIVDVFLVLPSIVLAIILVSVIGAGIFSIIVAIALTSLPVYARLARAVTLTLQQDEFVVAARVIGMAERRIIFRHVLPNALGPLIVQVSLGMGAALLTASALSFLGLGVQPPTAEWGAMLSQGRTYATAAPFELIIPGLAITLTILGFNLVGDGLRDALDPRQR